MKEFFRQSMAWLHTWSGLVPGWVLYFIFLTGTVGYFDTEIDRWMRPEMPVATYDLDAHEAVTVARARLERQAPEAGRWFINLPVDRNLPYLRIFWQQPGGGGNEYLDPASGEPLAARDTGGGQLLYRMHWNLHYLPRTLALWLVGAATLCMFVAIVTGIVIHVKIFKDFFTFRPAKGQRSWLDAHNVLSVSALPFHLMITFTGLLFMAFTYMPLIAAAHYGAGPEGRAQFSQEMFGDARNQPAAGVAQPTVALGALLDRATTQWGSGGISSVEITHPGDANARVIVNGGGRGVLRSSGALIFDGTSGELLEEVAPVTSMTRAVRDVLLGLHEGLFAGPLLRWLYVFSGLLGTAMIGTGLVLWVVKRRQRQQKQGGEGFGLRLVECLNIGTVIGLPVAIAAYFWANRLLPVELPQRGDWEVHAMFATWGVMLAHAALRPTERAWVEQLGIAALAFGLLPLLNAITTARGLHHSIGSGDWVFAGFDLSMLALALLAVWGVWRVSRRPLAAAEAKPRARRAVGEART